tara:strand:+ start:2495 stop:3481 length:987 start_codon:yes stop_codon:yes gene_type:complete
MNGCQKEININLGDFESKLVVNAQLTTDKYSSPYNGQNIMVSNSIDPFDSYYNFILTDDSIPIINYADVTVNEINNENSLEYKFEFNEDCYCYINRDFKPVENKTYSIEVKANDFTTINASETMPSKVDFTISNFELLSDINDNFESHLLKYDLCKLNISIIDDPHTNNYYRLRIKTGKPTNNIKPNFLFTGQRQRGEKKCIFKTQNNIFLNKENQQNLNNGYFEGQTAYFTDEWFNGEEENIFIEVDKPEGGWNYFYIEIISYSKNLYNYLINVKRENSTENNSLSNKEPVIFDSNISDGFGVFGGQSETRKTYLPLFYPTNGWVED